MSLGVSIVIRAPVADGRRRWKDIQRRRSIQMLHKECRSSALMGISEDDVCILVQYFLKRKNINRYMVYLLLVILFGTAENGCKIDQIDQGRVSY